MPNHACSTMKSLILIWSLCYLVAALWDHILRQQKDWVGGWVGLERPIFADFQYCIYPDKVGGVQKGQNMLTEYRNGPYS